MSWANITNNYNTNYIYLYYFRKSSNGNHTAYIACVANDQLVREVLHGKKVGITSQRKKCLTEKIQEIANSKLRYRLCVSKNLAHYLKSVACAIYVQELDNCIGCFFFLSLTVNKI